MEKEEKTRGMMRFCATFANNGFIGIPLALAVFGAGSPVMTVLIILNIVTNVLLYTLGVYLVSGDKSKMNLKNAILNPVLIAFVIGIVLNLANDLFHRTIPPFSILRFIIHKNLKTSSNI